MPWPLTDSNLSPQFVTLYRHLVTTAFTYEGCHGQLTLVPLLPTDTDLETLRHPFNGQAGVVGDKWCITRAQQLYKRWHLWRRRLRNDPDANHTDEDLCSCPWHLPYLSLYVTAVTALTDAGFYRPLCARCGVPEDAVGTNDLHDMTGPRWSELWRSVDEWSANKEGEEPERARFCALQDPAAHRNLTYVRYVLQNRVVNAVQLRALQSALGDAPATESAMRRAVRQVPGLWWLLDNPPYLEVLRQMLDTGRGNLPGGVPRRATGKLRLTVERRYSRISRVGWSAGLEDSVGTGQCCDRKVAWGGDVSWLRYDDQSDGRLVDALSFPDPTSPVPLCGDGSNLVIDGVERWSPARLRVLVKDEYRYVESSRIPHTGEVIIFAIPGEPLPLTEGAPGHRLELRGLLNGVEVYVASAADIVCHGRPWQRVPQTGILGTDGGIRTGAGNSPYFACALPRVSAPVVNDVVATTNKRYVTATLGVDGRLSLAPPNCGPVEVTISSGDAQLTVKVEAPRNPAPSNPIQADDTLLTPRYPVPIGVEANDRMRVGELLAPHARSQLLLAQVIALRGEVTKSTAESFLRELGCHQMPTYRLRDLCDLGHLSGIDSADAVIRPEPPVLLFCGHGESSDKIALWPRGALDWWTLLAEPSHHPFGITGVRLCAVREPGVSSRYPCIAAVGTPASIRQLALTLGARIRGPSSAPANSCEERPVWIEGRLPFPLEVFNPFNPSCALRVERIADWNAISVLLGPDAQIIHRSCTDNRTKYSSPWLIGRLRHGGPVEYWCPQHPDSILNAQWHATRAAWHRLALMAPDWAGFQVSAVKGALVDQGALIVPSRTPLPSYLRRWLSELTGVLPGWIGHSHDRVADRILRWHDVEPPPSGLQGSIPACSKYRVFEFPTGDMALQIVQRVSASLYRRVGPPLGD